MAAARLSFAMPRLFPFWSRQGSRAQSGAGDEWHAAFQRNPGCRQNAASRAVRRRGEIGHANCSPARAQCGREKGQIEHPAFRWIHLKADEMLKIQKCGASCAKPRIFLRTT